MPASHSRTCGTDPLQPSHVQILPLHIVFPRLRKPKAPITLDTPRKRNYITVLGR